MKNAFALALLLALAGCAGVPQATTSTSACSGGREASMDCQVERYSKAF